MLMVLHSQAFPLYLYENREGGYAYDLTVNRIAGRRLYRVFYWHDRCSRLLEDIEGEIERMNPDEYGDDYCLVARSIGFDTKELRSNDLRTRHDVDPEMYLFVEDVVSKGYDTITIESDDHVCDGYTIKLNEYLPMKILIYYDSTTNGIASEVESAAWDLRLSYPIYCYESGNDLYLTPYVDQNKNATLVYRFDETGVGNCHTVDSFSLKMMLSTLAVNGCLFKLLDDIDNNGKECYSSDIDRTVQMAIEGGFQTIEIWDHDKLIGRINTYSCEEFQTEEDGFHTIKVWDLKQ